jgi:hypothetical protein
MKSKLYCLIAGLSALSLSAGCSFDMGGGPRVKGSGVMKTESREVAGFTSISLQTVGKVTIQQTGKESLTIQAEDNILPLLESRVVDHALQLDTVKDANISPRKSIEYTVEVKSLEGLSVSGAGSIEAQAIQGKRLSVSISGVGSVTVAGSADALDLSLSGVGSYKGEEFKTKQATVHSSGVGKAVVNASEQLDASVSGVGTVEYLGSPQVQQSVSGVGKVRKR